jgi:hypothetical protein
MKAHRSIAIAGSAGLLGAGAFLLPAAASPAHSTHTLKFTAVALHGASFSKTSQGEADKAVVGGKIIGFDELYSVFDPTTMTGRGRVALVTGSGFLYGTLRFGHGDVTHGTVTGGTGKFEGVSGTILGTSLNKSGTRTAVTITYH